MGHGHIGIPLDRLGIDGVVSLPSTCSRSRSTWRCSRSTVAASDAVDAERCWRRPELPLGVDDDRLGGSVDRLAADPGDEGAGLVALGPDPDHLRLPGLAVVGDVDVVRAGGEVLAGAEAEAEVRAAGACFVERIRSRRRGSRFRSCCSESAKTPEATLSLPEVLLSERPGAARDVVESRRRWRRGPRWPSATLSWPVVLWSRALMPVAMLALPVVLGLSAFEPVATLSLPVVLSVSAW